MSPFYELLQISLSTRDSFTTLPTTEQWAEIFNEADRQCVLGIMCVGVEKVVQRCGGLEKSRIDPDLFATWYSYTQKTKERNLELNRKSAWLQNWLSKQGFGSCILKGQGNALMYPDPLLRTSGDIDVWMWKKEYDESHLTGRYSGSQNREDIVQWVLGKMNGKYAEIAVHHVQMETLGGVEVEGHYWPNFFFSRPRMKDFERSPNSGRCRCNSSLYLAHVLFKLGARAHDLVTAAETAELKIRTYSQNLPFLAAAGMGFFHCEGISDLNIHYFLISSQYLFAACSVLLSPNS